MWCLSVGGGGEGRGKLRESMLETSPFACYRNSGTHNINSLLLPESLLFLLDLTSRFRKIRVFMGQGQRCQVPSHHLRAQ